MIWMLPKTEETNPLDPAFFESQTFREVFRSMAVKLKVVKIAPSVGGQRPTIHFTGGMGDPTTGSMTGFVEMTPESNVRWHFVSVLATCNSGVYPLARGINRSPGKRVIAYGGGLILIVLRVTDNYYSSAVLKEYKWVASTNSQSEACPLMFCKVGGVRSLYGVLGTWTTIFHDFDDPVGMNVMREIVALLNPHSTGPFWLRRLVGAGER